MSGQHRFLTAGSGGGGGTPSPLTTKGDLYGYDTSDERIPIGTDGQTLIADSAEALGLRWGTPAASAHIAVLPFTYVGALAIYNGGLRLPILWTGTVTKVRAMVGVAPTGSSIILDVVKNGTTSLWVNAGDRPTIAAAGNDSGAGVAPDQGQAVVAGDYLEVNVVQIGSTTPGEDLVLLAEITQ